MATRKALTVQLPADVVDRVRATVVGLRSQGLDATVAGAAAASLTAWCVEQEQRHHRGHPFPPAGRVPAGRRLPASVEALSTAPGASTEAPAGKEVDGPST